MWPVDDQNLFPGDESQREIGGGEAVGPSKNLSKTVESGKESGANLTLAEDGNNQPLLSEKEDVKSARTDQDALPIPVAAPVTGVVGAIDAKIVPNGGEEFPVSIDNKGVEQKESGNNFPQIEEKGPRTQDQSISPPMKPTLDEMKATQVNGEVRTTTTTATNPATSLNMEKDTVILDRDEGDDETVEETSSKKPRAFNFASHDAGAIVLDKAASAKGFNNLLDDDKDKYGISPCSDKKWVVIGLSEDIVVTSVVIANYEKYSSMLNEFQVLAATSFPTEEWMNLGSYNAAPFLGEQT